MLATMVLKSIPMLKKLRQLDLSALRWDPELDKRRDTIFAALFPREAAQLESSRSPEQQQQQQRYVVVSVASAVWRR